MVKQGRNGIVYACIEQGKLQGFNRSGEVVWNATGHGSFDWFTGVDATEDGVVYAVAKDGYFFSFAPDGSHNWKVKVIDPVWNCRGTEREFTAKGMPIILNPDRIAVLSIKYSGLITISFRGLFNAQGEQIEGCDLADARVGSNSIMHWPSWQVDDEQLYTLSGPGDSMPAKTFDHEGNLTWEKHLAAVSVVVGADGAGLPARAMYDRFQNLHGINPDGDTVWEYKLPVGMHHLRQCESGYLLVYGGTELIAINSVATDSVGERMVWRYSAEDGNYHDTVTDETGVVTALRCIKREYFLDKIGADGELITSRQVGRFSMSRSVLAEDGTLYILQTDGWMKVVRVE